MATRDRKGTTESAAPACDGHHGAATVSIVTGHVRSVLELAPDAIRAHELHYPTTRLRMANQGESVIKFSCKPRENCL